MLVEAALASLLMRGIRINYNRVVWDVWKDFSGIFEVDTLQSRSALYWDDDYYNYEARGYDG